MTQGDSERNVPVDVRVHVCTLCVYVCVFLPERKNPRAMIVV